VGQIDLDVEGINADFYTSNCHKWMLTPKGTAFLHVHATQREAFEPLVISWAEINQPSFSLRHEMWGTRDMAAFLSIPAAIKFRKKHEWETRNFEAQKLLHDYRDRFSDTFGRKTICDHTWLAQIASVLLPEKIKAGDLWRYLWEEYRIEAMITGWRDEIILRLSFNAYNTRDELDLLLSAIQKFIHK
jgi:isopenicillin-N epimerase